MVAANDMNNIRTFFATDVKLKRVEFVHEPDEQERRLGEARRPFSRREARRSMFAWFAWFADQTSLEGAVAQQRF
jgi:hypothetical protein